MHAIVYHGPGEKSWDEVPDPKIDDPGDVLVQIDTTTICGTDLHILKGDVPAVTPGRVLGHEAVATVLEVGAGVRNRQVGERILVSCISACGRCPACRRGQYGLCRGGGGWIFGHLIDGLQAELARVPFADTSTYPVPEGLSDEQVLYLADILPTGYEVGVLRGRVQPGDVVAIVGAGPIGLAAIMGARLLTPRHIVAIDPAEPRREAAMRFGADSVAEPADAEQVVHDLTDGLGADVTIEAVGIPETFAQVAELVRPGGHIANIGVHGEPVTLHLEELWIKGLTITTALVDTFTTPRLLDLVVSGRTDPTKFTSHRFALSDSMEAYDTFSRPAETNAMKVLIER